MAFSVYILRRGETNANASGVIQGSAIFYRLTQNGRMQAAQVPLALQGVLTPLISSLHLRYHEL